MDIVLILLIIFTVLQILDVYTTYKILSNGGRELNPLVRWVIEKVGLVLGISSLKVILVACLTVIWYNNMLPVWAMVVADVVYAGVIAYNMKSIKY